MTEQEAKNILHDLWESGEIPSNFDENHSDYEKAVNYTIKNGYFDIDSFLEDSKIISFGVWHIESDALIGKVGYDYIIGCTRFWETREYNGFLVWDWLIHFTTKSWFKGKVVNDFNTAFFFCQDYFKENKPQNLPYVSTAQTLYIQNQLVQIGKEMSKYEKFNNGILEVDEENILKYRELKSKIKFL